MSPILTAVPAVPPTWELEGIWPSYTQANDFPDDPGPAAWAWRGPGGFVNEPPSGGGAIVVSGPATGGGGVISRIESTAGVNMCVRYSTTGVVQSQTWRLPWVPSWWTPAASMGALITREDFRCCWLRECFLFNTGTGDAGCGRVLSFDAGAVAAVHWAQAGDAVQQVGVYGDGLGGLAYRSYSAAPALLETVPLAMVAGWNVSDWILISNGAGRVASLRLKFNGVNVVQRDFGTANLPFPSGGSRTQWVERMNNTAGQLFLNYLHLRCGRFTPEGQELTT